MISYQLCRPGWSVGGCGRMQPQTVTAVGRHQAVLAWDEPKWTRSSAGGIKCRYPMGRCALLRRRSDGGQGGGTGDPRSHATTAASMEQGQRPPRGSAGLGRQPRVWHSPGRMFRVIAHLDMDGLFASVEHRDNPALPGRPVIVGTAPAQHGVVRAACMRHASSASPSPAFACTGRVLASSCGVVAQ